MKNSKFQTSGRLAVVLALLILIAVIGLGRAAAQPAAQPQFPPSDDPQVQKLTEWLERAGLSDETRQGLEEKRIMAERMALERVDPQALPVEQRGAKVAPPLAAPLVEEPAQELWEGIFEGSEGLVRPSVAQVINGWQGRSAGTEYQVFAGSTPEQPARGLLLVAELDENLPTASRQTYLAPEGVVSLKVIEIRQNGLLLETDTQNRLYFDLATRQFQPAE